MFALPQHGALGLLSGRDPAKHDAPADPERCTTPDGEPEYELLVRRVSKEVDAERFVSKSFIQGRTCSKEQRAGEKARRDDGPEDGALRYARLLSRAFAGFWRGGDVRKALK